MAAVVRSVASYLAGGGARSLGFDRESANVACIRLDAETENTVRYVFCDWESAAGVRSNHGAQVERVAAGIFREALHLESGAAKRRREAQGVVSPVSGTFYPGGIPRSERGWRTETARPTGASGGGFPLRTITISGRAYADDDGVPVRCTVGAPERWAMLPRALPGHRGPVARANVIRVWRALRSLEARSSLGPRLLVALHMAYGQRDPSADYHAFGDVAPLVHLTDAAHELAVKATKAERRARAEADAPSALSETERAEWIVRRIAKDRGVVHPRAAVAAHLERLKGPERRLAVQELGADARRLLTRASNALLRELREGGSR